MVPCRISISISVKVVSLQFQPRGKLLRGTKFNISAHILRFDTDNQQRSVNQAQISQNPVAGNSPVGMMARGKQADQQRASVS